MSSAKNDISDSSESTLMFTAPSSSFLPSFWETLYDLKLNHFQLESSITAVTSFVSSGDGSLLAAYSFDHYSLLEDRISENRLSIEGKLLNVNTIEEFRAVDKQSLLNDHAKTIWDSITCSIDCPDSAIKDPSKLFNFLVLTFADLKAYKFYYWFSYPALLPNVPLSTVNLADRNNSRNVVDFNDSMVSLIKIREIDDLVESISGLDVLTGIYTHPTFIRLLKSNQFIFVVSVTKAHDLNNNNQRSVQVYSLEEGWNDRYSPNAFICVLDSITSAVTVNNNASVSWQIRNVLSFLSYHQRSMTGGDNSNSAVSLVSSDESQSTIPRSNVLKLICLRGKLPSIFATQSPLSVNRTDESALSDSVFMTVKIANSFAASVADSLPPLPRVVGWELNERGRPGPRLADLSSVLDSHLLMKQAVDLNLRLMKWRLWPEVNTDKLAATKCLLFGAGTLGCAVARVLIGWGVRHITLIDSGRVSFSNPTRQSLFTYDDARQHKFKAIAAATALQQIFPDVNAKGIVCTIPMPGHTLSTPDAVKDSDTSIVETVNVDIMRTPEILTTRPASDIITYLDRLVFQHDVCFALTDSREARWLPTMLCAHHDKILINSALGFDSCLVMRHGHGLPSVSECSEDSIHTDLSSDQDNKSMDSYRLGCYFCTDITAASNSQRDRTLDQQCTVTRPGLSYIAAGLAVELMVSILHSSQQQYHPPPNNDDEETLIPHQIRGNLSAFQQQYLQTPAFGCCIACSHSIVSAYRHNPIGFVSDVCRDPIMLEQVSGISMLTEGLDGDLDSMDFDEEED